MLTLRWFAKMYGWTPDVVGQIPARYIDWYRVIEEADGRAAKIRQDQQRKPGRG